MKTLAITLFLALASFSSGGERKADSIKATDDFRKSVASAEKVIVYEGLPHQMFEGELLQKESQRPDVLKIASYPFYTPATPAKNQDHLRKLLADPKSVIAWRGEKRCGGFHPDYSISWTSGSKTYYALICFGCHEVIFSEGKRQFRYDLTEEAYDAFKEDLSSYASKRPHRNKG